MIRTRWQPLAVGALIVFGASCSASNNDVRQTSFQTGSTAAKAVTFDAGVEWSCGDADLQAMFLTTLRGDALVSAVKAAIADPTKADATFSFVAPIKSFSTNFDAHALCVKLDDPSDASSTAALVTQLRASGNVTSIRPR